MFRSGIAYDRRVHLLLVSSYAPKHVGGIERVAYNLARVFSEKEGVTVEWCVSDCDLQRDLPLVRYVPMRTWNVLEAIGFLPYPFWSPRSLARLRDAVRRADVVHIHDYIYMGSIAAFFFAKRYRKPVVLTQHIARITFRNPVLSLLLTVLNNTLGRFILNRADEVVCVAEHLRSYFQPLLKRGAHVILNGVDDAIFRRSTDSPSAVREELRLPNDRPLLLFVGRFVEKKGIRVLEHLARRTTHCTWLLIGSGSIDPVAWNLPNVIVHSQIADNDELLARYYQAADLFVFPAQGEGFPLVLMEALACGLPIMISQQLLIPDPIPFRACVTVDDDGAPDGARETWETALSENVSTDTLERLRAAVPTDRVPWHWEATAERYGAVYESALRG